MKKLLFFLSVFLIMFVPFQEIRADGDDNQIPISFDEGGTNGQGPIYHVPALVPITGYYSSTLSTIVVNFPFNLGYVSIEIENQTTGEYSQSLVNALAGPMLLPISGTVGQWTITFTLASGTVYCGEFAINYLNTR